MNKLVIILIYFFSTVISGQIKPSVTLDPTTGNYICIYQGEEQVHEVIFEPKTKIEPIVKAKVIFSVLDSNFIYNYVVSNSSTSIQRLRVFDISILSSIHNKIGPSVYWRTLYYSFVPVFGWAHSIGYAGVAHPLDGIAPDSSLSGFGFSSYGLPSITNGYFQGNAMIPLAFPDEGDERITELLRPLRKFPNNRIIKKTIGPKDPPVPLIPLEFIDTLVAYKHRSYELGWIDNQGIVNSLDQKLENARAKILQGKINTAINKLRAFVNQVEAQNGNHLTSEAYALLKFNAEYLIEKLEE